MRVLIADDEVISRSLLETSLTYWGHEVVVTEDGDQALEALQMPDSPKLAVLDWIMPGMDGIEVCRELRKSENGASKYLILLTGKGKPEDVVAGLTTGADDYVTKPFMPEEFKARVEVGQRVLALQENLARRVRELEEALSKIKQLQGLLPICSYCKSIRNASDYWEDLESYIRENSDADFSHGVCPTCYDSVVKPELELLKNRKKPQRQ